MALMQFSSIFVRLKPTVLGAEKGALLAEWEKADFIKQSDRENTRIPPSPPSIVIASFRSNDLKFSTKIAIRLLSMIVDFYRLRGGFKSSFCRRRLRAKLGADILATSPQRRDLELCCQSAQRAGTTDSAETGPSSNSVA
jgi:hypothetical protein